MTSIDLTQQLHNEDDSVTTEKKDGKDMPVTLKIALTRAMLADVDKEGQPVRGDAKIKRYDLYYKIKTAGSTVDFTPEEIVMLREGVLAFSTLTSGQIRTMLDPRPKAAEEAKG